MDLLVKRGVAHIVKKIPAEKPLGLNAIQSLYYEYVKTGKSSDETFNVIMRDDPSYTIQDEDYNHLWIVIVMRKRNIFRKYISEKKRDTEKIANICVDTDAFEFMGLVKSLEIMQYRYKNEKEYFELVSEYYSNLINATMRDPVQFFQLSKESLTFIRQILKLDVARFELSPIAYEVFKSKEYYLVGIPKDLENEELFYEKLLEMTTDISSFYNKLRKHTELFLNNLNFNFVNNVDKNGHDIVDYPWFKLSFSHVRDDLVHVESMEGTKPYSHVYCMKFNYNLIEQDGKKFVSIEGYPLVQLPTETDQVKLCNKKFLEHFNVK